MYFAGAFGSKILAMQPMNSQFNNSTAGVPIYDVHMRGLLIGPWQRLDPVGPIYIPVDGKLFALAAGSFQLLYPPPCDRSGWEDFVWMWHTLPDPPFQREHVTSYAVHSDGRTIFVSTRATCCGPVTFSFDTRESVMRNACWKKQGHWQMPFHGRAYFVPELDAWVGLSENPGPSCRICSMDVISDKCDAINHDRVVKFSKEGIFETRPNGATLVSLGGCKFCIVEFNGDFVPNTCFKLILRLMTFSLSYDKNGDLTTGNSLQFREYSVPAGVSKEMLSIPVAFWM